VEAARQGNCTRWPDLSCFLRDLHRFFVVLERGPDALALNFWPYLGLMGNLAWPWP